MDGYLFGAAARGAAASSREEHKNWDYTQKCCFVDAFFAARRAARLSASGEALCCTLAERNTRSQDALGGFSELVKHPIV
jgi:hypothetical protein